MAYLDSSRLGNSLTVRNNRYEFRFNCPFCSDESYHLYVNIQKQQFFCHRCNQKGKTNVTPQFLNIVVASYKEKEIAQEDLPLKLPSSCPEIITPAARNYLFKRGILESDVYRHKIFAASAKSIYFGRIIIPCNPFMGFSDYFVARCYNGFLFPKYLNPPGGKHKQFISPVEPDKCYSQYWNDDTVLLVEGPFDYLKASRHGRTICLLGKNLSRNLARDIVTKFSNVYIMLDKGTQETVSAILISDTLRSIVDDVKIFECPKKDPGEMNPEDFKELFKY